MNSSLKKRLPGILATGLVALAVGAAGAPTVTASTDASVSGLTKAQKKAKAKALKKCKKKRAAKARKKCIKKVNKKFAAKAKPKGKTKRVDVLDDYFTPAELTIKRGDWVNWVWGNENANAHNVSLDSGPASLTAAEKYKLSTANAPQRNYSFKRQLNKVGQYNFYCSLHAGTMYMTIQVTK